MSAFLRPRKLLILVSFLRHVPHIRLAPDTRYDAWHHGAAFTVDFLICLKLLVHSHARYPVFSRARSLLHQARLIWPNYGHELLEASAGHECLWRATKAAREKSNVSFDLQLSRRRDMILTDQGCAGRPNTGGISARSRGMSDSPFAPSARSLVRALGVMASVSCSLH
jgi:hypothetical protein